MYFGIFISIPPFRKKKLHTDWKLNPQADKNTNVTVTIYFCWFLIVPLWIEHISEMLSLYNDCWYYSVQYRAFFKVLALVICLDLKWTTFFFLLIFFYFPSSLFGILTATKCYAYFAFHTNSWVDGFFIISYLLVLSFNILQSPYTNNYFF